jgi:hypothetical protein
VVGGRRRRGLVRDHHDRATGGGDLPQQREDLGARALVEVPGRLVGEDHGRVVDERPCDREALLLAAAELVRRRARDVREPEPLDEPASALARAGQPRREQDVALAGQLRQQVEELEDEADMVASQGAQLALRGARDAPPGDDDLARVGAVEPAEQVQERGLARPAAAEDGDDLARPDVEVGAVEDPARAAPAADRLDEAAGGDERTGAVRGRGRQGASGSSSIAQELMQ